MTLPIPQPRRPEPLPGAWLGLRAARNHAWEDYNRASEEKLREIKAWAEEALVNLFIEEDLGLKKSDPAYGARVDDLYDTIRNALTRQDLIIGFLTTVQESAQRRAAEQLKEFNRQLEQLTDPDVF